MARLKKYTARQVKALETLMDLVAECRKMRIPEADVRKVVEGSLNHARRMG